MTRLDAQRSELQSFVTEIGEGVARRIDLLRQIDTTISYLVLLRDQLTADARFAVDFNREIESIVDVIDLDGSLHDRMESTQETVNAVYEMLIRKRDAARKDRLLRADEGVVEAYTEAIAAAADLHNAINTLRWSIAEHDVDVAGEESNTPAFTNPDELLRHLRSL